MHRRKNIFNVSNIHAPGRHAAQPHFRGRLHRKRRVATLFLLLYWQGCGLCLKACRPLVSALYHRSIHIVLISPLVGLLHHTCGTNCGERRLHVSSQGVDTYISSNVSCEDCRFCSKLTYSRSDFLQMCLG